jgi:hypothetical protein
MYNPSTLPDTGNHLIERCPGRGSSATEDLSQCASVIATLMTTAAQYVCGAGTRRLHLRVELVRTAWTICVPDTDTPGAVGYRRICAVLSLHGAGRYERANP